MRSVNLSGIDLNLLVALDALLRESSVSRAATAMGLSQPMNRALLGFLTPFGWARGLAINRTNIMACVDEGGERYSGKCRRAHENQAHGVKRPFSQRARALFSACPFCV